MKTKYCFPDSLSWVYVCLCMYVAHTCVLCRSVLIVGVRGAVSMFTSKLHTNVDTYSSLYVISLYYCMFCNVAKSLSVSRGV